VHGSAATNVDCRNAWCDACGARIGGARLFCLDCDTKDTASFDMLDLCSARECMAARITHRPDLKVTHEPSHHRLVKIRTVVLKRQHGRVHTAALAAYERVQSVYPKIAQSPQQSVQRDVTRPDTKNRSSPEPTRAPAEPYVGPLNAAPDTIVQAEDNEGIPQGQTQPQDSDLPSCGKCTRRLSFPCWYCIYCEGPSPTLLRSEG
jgi:hypothetical protein